MHISLFALSFCLIIEKMEQKKKKMDLDPGFYLFLHFLIMWNRTQLNQIIQLLLVEWWLFFSWDPNNENPKALKRQFLLDKMKFCIVYIRSL